MQTWGYRILTVILLGLFGIAWAAAYFGWGLASTATTASERTRVRNHSARIGGAYYGGGPRYGK